jgi:hypothetical protein
VLRLQALVLGLSLCHFALKKLIYKYGNKHYLTQVKQKEPYDGHEMEIIKKYLRLEDGSLTVAKRNSSVNKKGKRKKTERDTYSET